MSDFECNRMLKYNIGSNKISAATSKYQVLIGNRRW
jgi:hypothetical protein